MLIEKLGAFIAQTSEEIYKVLTEDKKEDKTPPLPPPSEITCGLIINHHPESLKIKFGKQKIAKINKEGQVELKNGKDKDIDRVVIKI